LGTVGAWIVSEEFVLDGCSAVGSVDSPGTFIEFVHRKRRAGEIAGANPVDVLGEVTDLVKSVPDRQL
jgi:hypothetical protein